MPSSRTCKTPPSLETPYGAIVFEVARGYDYEVELIAVSTVGKLLGSNRSEIGKCKFLTYRRKRNRPWLDAEFIASEMDALSHEAMQIAEALLEADPISLEWSFNKSCLLVADRITITPEHRGSGAWKALYFTTMEQALRQAKALPDEFFFKVFPLQFENNVTDENLEAFEKAERQLRLLYAIHLNAAPLDLPKQYDCFMRAPIPAHILSSIESTASRYRHRCILTPPQRGSP